jgi:hypothetical protein
MLYMKEDDMDDMMRKAAENYEVDAEQAADWQAVYKAVHESEDRVIEEKKKKRRFAFWWLLLIPLGWIANTEYNTFKNAHTKQVTILPVAESKTNNTNNSNDQHTSSAAPGLKTNNVKENNNNIAKENNTAAGKQTGAFSLKHFTAKTNSQNETQTNSNDNLNNNNTVVQTQQPENNKPETASSSAAPVNVTAGNNNSFSNPSDKTATENKTDNTSPALINDTTTNHNNNNVVAQKSSAPKTKTNDHYFYAGIVAGADLSFVKYQDVEPLGYNAGLLVGYKFNKRLSIESGFYMVKKNYYTKGEYFDKSNLSYFNDRTMIDAKGYCKMYEIPLNIKFDISTRKKHTWFATTGLSSYLMNKEYYHYNIDSSGTLYSGSKPYYNKTQNWFSILNVSAGYELRTGNKTNLRIEPYFKTTLSGAGLGNLSIESFGINAGIVRRIP